MWALRPPPLRPHHLDDPEGPIDLRKKAALDRDSDHDDPRSLDDDYSSPRDLTVGRRCHHGQQQQQNGGVLPVRGLHPFMAERYGARCNVLVAPRDEDVGVQNGHHHPVGDGPRNGHDIRNLWNGRHPVRHQGLDVRNCHDADPRNGRDFGNGHGPPRSDRDVRNGHETRNDARNGHETRNDVRNGHVLELAASRLQGASKERPADEKEPRCKSTDAVFGKEGGLKAPRSSSCPDLTCVDLSPTPPSPPSHLHGNGPFPTSPLGGAKKRKSFVPAHGDRSPSPAADLAHGGSPSPKRPSPVYVHKTHLHHHSPSPSPPAYGGEKLYYSPRGAVDDPQRRYHSPPSPPRPPHHLPSHSPSPTSRGYQGSPSPPPRHQPYHGKGYRSPSPYRTEGYLRSPSPTSRRSPPPHYDEYFSHPEVLLRRQLGHHHHHPQQHPGAAPPFYLHVYDYYQHLVQRLREQSSPSPAGLLLRGASPPDREMVVDHAERKRPCRALTGKHVRQGTGASLSTLLSLRQMIQERQKAKERQPLRPALNGNGKAVRKFPPKKARLNNGKSPLSKVSC